MRILALSGSDVRQALPMADAVAAVREAFAALSTGRAAAAPRGVIRIDETGGATLLMGAALAGRALASKTVSVFPGNRARSRPVVSGLVVVLDPETGEPSAICEGTALTALRTGAASGVATDLLARREARVGALIGCGAQGRTQLLAMEAVRELEEVRVCARRPDGARRFVERMAGEARSRLRAVRDAAEALEGADVVCVATTSATPVFDGALLERGAHVNGVGSFTLAMRELDGTTVERARIFVDARESALAEAGDLVAAEAEGRTRREAWTEIGRVAAGLDPGRRGPDEITLFKSVGHAVQDVAAASRVLAVALERGLGREVEL